MKRFHCHTVAIRAVLDIGGTNKSQQATAIDLFTKALRAAHTAGRRAERGKKKGKP